MNVRHYPVIQRAKRLVRDKQGVLSRDLLRAPGGFGLGQVPQRLQPDATTTMVCGYCSIGCGLDVHLKHGQAVNLSPTTQYAVNLGMACPKGWEALTPLNAPDRATSPMLRDAGGRLRAVDWPTALDTFVSRMKGIQAKYGKESVAFISTGQIPMEEMALLGALGKFGMGLLHGDGNTRQCMATLVVAYKQAFGFDAPPYTYKDLEESDVIIFIGANPCIAHPILWERVCKNPHQPEIVVIDPRRTETAQAATRHLPLRAQVRPGAVVRRRPRAGAPGMDRPTLHRRAHQRLRGVLRAPGSLRAGGRRRALRPERRRHRRAGAHDILQRLDFLVVQDMYHSTETAAFADLVLPAAGWGEKEGVFINSERRLGVIKQVAKGAGAGAERLPHLQADRRGVGLRRRVSEVGIAGSGLPAAQGLLGGHAVRHRRASDGYRMLDAKGGIQWPLPAGESVDAGSERRLFEDGRFYTDDGRARFVFEAPRPLPEPTSPAYPFTLLTGRGTSSQWHTQTRTAKSRVLRKLYPNAPYVELSPKDAADLGLHANAWVIVRSQRGQVRARAFVSHVVQPGQVFMPMHDAATNQLTFAAFDPYSRQPSYKACAVRIEPAPTANS